MSEAQAAGRGRRLLACWCVLLATPSFVFCGLRHVCVCGHMAHGIWPRWHWLNDAFWITAFAVAMVASVRSDLRYKLLFPAFVALATLLRFSWVEHLDLAPMLGAASLALWGLLVPPPTGNPHTADFPGKVTGSAARN